MSSSYENYPGYNCIDGNMKTMCHTIEDEAWPWVAVEIPRSIVYQVRISNRADCCGDRTKNMKVWVGDQLPITAGDEYSSVIQLIKLFHIHYVFRGVSLGHLKDLEPMAKR